MSHLIFLTSVVGVYDQECVLETFNYLLEARGGFSEF